MNALIAIRERKTLLEADKWHDGKMPRTAFPLSKTHTYALGSRWQWCVWRLAARDRRYRLLVAFDPAKEQYQAWLGLEAGTDQALLARLEYHPTHRGWHCHVKTGTVEDVGCGVVRHPSSRETVKVCSDGGPFEGSQLSALGIACRVFNVEMEAVGGMFQ